jgi:hypothetical protein
MRFKLHHDVNEILTCDFCGAERFVLVPGRQVCNSDLVADYVFFRCGECSQMGFWTHRELIDKRSNTSRAVQKEVSAERDEQKPSQGFQHERI